MVLLKLIFWISCFLVFYNYAGYAIVAFILNRIGKRGKKGKNAENYYPFVSFIVAAYNEEDCIEKKIINSLEQNYPSDRIEYIFITDGSTDNTPDIIRNYSSVKLLHDNIRRGKSAALNRAVKASENEILIFSDANTMLNKNATFNIARHYIHKNVGGVAGEKKVLSVGHTANEVGSSEGLYWKYESFLKRIDSDFYSVVGAAGELFSVRKDLFEVVPDEVILDDFIVSMKVAQKGYRIIYEPEAYAMELPSFSLKDEQKRKVRIAAGGFQAISMLPQALQFWKSPKLSFLYISHRLMRWTVSPLCLITAFISNLLLAFLLMSPVYTVLFTVQLAFYVCAILMRLFPTKNKWLKLLKLPYYFVFMNISVIQGFYRFLLGKQSAAWEKANRTKSILLESHMAE